LELALATERKQGDLIKKPNSKLIRYILDIFCSNDTYLRGSGSLKSMINEPLFFYNIQKKFIVTENNHCSYSLDCSKLEGQTPFLLACSLLGNEKKLLEKFVKCGANINSRDAEGNDAITILIHQGIELPHWAKEHYSNWERTDSKSRNLFHLVCESDGNEIANTKILLEKSKKHLLNEKDSEGRTPLMIAYK
jgi:ankyrin repeat protein